MPTTEATSRQSARETRTAMTTVITQEAAVAMIPDELEVELVPQGTLAERIRAGGFGLGGVLTRTGLGTLVEQGKRKVEIDGEAWLLETPLRADFALVACRQADTFGNLTYELTA